MNAIKDALVWVFGATAMILVFIFSMLLSAIPFAIAIVIAVWIVRSCT